MDNINKDPKGWTITMAGFVISTVLSLIEQLRLCLLVSSLLGFLPSCEALGLIDSSYITLTFHCSASSDVCFL